MDGGTPGNNVSIGEALAVKEGQQPLCVFGLAGKDIGLLIYLKLDLF